MTAKKSDLTPEDFKGRVICKKCGKDIDFTLGSELFQKCPRCNGKIDRDIVAEDKQAKKIIKFDILRRAKKYTLEFGVFFALAAIAWNIIGFYGEWFEDGKWWLALLSLPFIAISYICTRITRLKSASKRYRILAWAALILICIALALSIATTVWAI